jgi:hypothetical protein
MPNPDRVRAELAIRNRSLARARLPRVYLADCLLRPPAAPGLGAAPGSGEAVA